MSDFKITIIEFELFFYQKYGFLGIFFFTVVDIFENVFAIRADEQNVFQSRHTFVKLLKKKKKSERGHFPSLP